MIRIAIVQQDFPVGDLAGNLDRALSCIRQARLDGAALVLFPELALTGYPPEDLLLRPGFLRRTHECLERLVVETDGVDVVMGHPWVEQGARYNAVSWIRSGQILGRYFKQHLPNYAVFDERRYFAPGSTPLVRTLDDCPMGVILCEDAWESAPAIQAKAAGARLLLVPNASPYRDDKLQARQQMLASRHAETGLPMVYCNLLGGQDELVFDGRSMLLDGRGVVSAIGPHCQEALLHADFEPSAGRLVPLGWPVQAEAGIPEIYQVLVRGTLDYVRKNGFSDVVLGLSGGVDSALVLAVCADALGPARVHALMMPSEFTSQLSLDLAQQQANRMGVDYRVLPIDAPMKAMQEALRPALERDPAGVTHENLQARIRGMLVMALSNQHGWLPIATSNKSELAVGYSTLYGDMCGGFAPLKDCLKTRVYELARHRNENGETIPVGVLDRAPSAELRPDQTDQDSLPAYEVLDAILLRYVDRDHSIQDIVAEGFDEATVRRVAAMVLRNEYKRRQGPPGVRVTSRGFGRDRRYPITSGWREDSADS
jgi:NAD+ synthase (glutamine-hydrolysing)